MKAHLSDEEWLDYLNQDANEMVHAHLQFCRECRQEAERLHGRLVGFADSVKAEAAAAEAKAGACSQVSSAFGSANLGHHLSYRRWAPALAAGLILAASALFLTRQPSAPVPGSGREITPGPPIAQTHEDSARQPASTPAAARHDTAAPAGGVSDDALLREVQSDTSVDMPQALQPVALIVAQRNQFAEQLTQLSQGENE
jgi:hypothetical protein